MTDCDFPISPMTLLLIGAAIEDDVPARPKPAARTNAIAIERINFLLDPNVDRHRTCRDRTLLRRLWPRTPRAQVKRRAANIRTV